MTEKAASQSPVQRESLHRFYSRHLPLAVMVVIFAIAAYYLIQDMRYSRHFQDRKAETRAAMQEKTEQTIRSLVKEVSRQTAAALAASADSLERSRQMQRLERHLASIATEIENLSISDRSASLDNVFERFSALLAVVTLIFAGLGIFAGLQFRDQKRDVEEQLQQMRVDIDEESKKALAKINHTVGEVTKNLNAAVERSLDIVWVAGNTLEKQVDVGMVDRDKALELLAYLYKTGFRLELFTGKEKERLSALQNLYAQGDCTDLKNLYAIWQDESEPAKVRNLARKALHKILKRCPHDGEHPELDVQDEKFGSE